ncbi:MAG: hypothetical protein PHG18_03825 [Bacilli bacterium]|nr:hypothetical protein [Bacilli bacterium]
MNIKKVINEIKEEDINKVNWSKIWNQKYPILNAYQSMENIENYQNKIRELYIAFKEEYKTSNQDTVLILKDILYQEYLRNK